MTLHLISRCFTREMSRRLVPVTVLGLQQVHQVAAAAKSSSSSTAARQMATSAVFRPTLLLNEKITMKVPTMGDSITEGAIVEWAVGVGEAVKEGDVILLVETDKVTIDIKAEFDGVLVKQYGEVDDTVEVGAELYQIDTEGEATIVMEAETGTSPEEERTGTSEDESSTPPPSSIETTTVSTSTEEHVRKPSIQFLGKTGWKEKLSVVAESSPQIIAAPMKPNGAITLEGGPLAPMYGRTPFSEREMEALIMGGASEAPY